MLGHLATSPVKAVEDYPGPLLNFFDSMPISAAFFQSLPVPSYRQSLQPIDLHLPVLPTALPLVATPPVVNVAANLLQWRIDEPVRPAIVILSNRFPGGYSSLFQTKLELFVRTIRTGD